jgi:hypothetical protein
MHLAKGRFRMALRADVQLLYTEEVQEGLSSSKTEQID